MAIVLRPQIRDVISPYVYSAGRPSCWALAHISSSFFLAYSERSQIGCLSYFHTWCGLSANLECRSEMCCTRLAENTGHKKSPKIAICASSHNFVGLYLCNESTYGQSEKNLLKTGISRSRRSAKFARRLAVSWAGTLYIHFGGSCP